MSVLVVRPGLLTTVQDLGRLGHQHEGVSVGGAMDADALRLANITVGNAEHDAGLEVTLLGPTLEFQDDVVICIAGADLNATLAGRRIPLLRAVHASAGTQLTFGQRVNGCRAYIAFGGGIDVPPVLGSRATHLRARFGGLDGRALRKDDVLAIGDPGNNVRRVAASLAAGNVVQVGGPIREPPRDEAMVRVIRGRHFDLLTAESRDALLSADGESFRITPQSDRMGYRLEGPRLTLKRAIEMISEPVVFGTVQLPPDGNPIILMADRQTTGGYPRILDVASIDIPLLAQAAPGTRIRFVAVSLEEAQTLYMTHATGWPDFATGLKL